MGAPMPVFKTGAFNRSATCPGQARHFWATRVSFAIGGTFVARLPVASARLSRAGACLARLWPTILRRFAATGLPACARWMPVLMSGLLQGREKPGKGKKLWQQT